MKKLKQNKFLGGGFTLIEVAVVMGIFVVLASFTTVNLLAPQRSADLNSTLTSITSDIRQQQARSMLGESGGGPSAVLHGIFFEGTKYTLFKGASYNPSDPSNFVVDLPASVSLATSFPGSVVVFNLQSGEVNGFVDGSNTVTLHSSGGQSKVLTFNKYGAISVN